MWLKRYVTEVGTSFEVEKNNYHRLLVKVDRSDRWSLAFHWGDLAAGYLVYLLECLAGSKHFRADHCSSENCVYSWILLKEILCQSYLG